MRRLKPPKRKPRRIHLRNSFSTGLATSGIQVYIPYKNAIKHTSLEPSLLQRFQKTAVLLLHLRCSINPVCKISARSKSWKANWFFLYFGGEINSVVHPKAVTLLVAAILNPLTASPNSKISSFDTLSFRKSFCKVQYPRILVDN